MSRKQTLIWMAIVSIGLTLSTPASAAPCQKLSGKKLDLAKKLFKSTYPYDCCDETLDRCLKQKKVCKLARRLRDAICRRVAEGQNEKKIKQALERRSRSMTPMGKRATFSLSGAQPAGDPKAKVVIVAYACARCQFCSKLIPQLRRLATGSHKGKVKLYLRIFPIRGHKHSASAGLAMLAASHLGKFWPYVLKVYAEFASFSKDKLTTWADQLGLDKNAFARELADPKNRKTLVSSKKEGLRNGVDATPTLFINGRRYYGEQKITLLKDIFDEEYDRITGKIYCK